MRSFLFCLLAGVAASGSGSESSLSRGRLGHRLGTADDICRMGARGGGAGGGGGGDGMGWKGVSVDEPSPVCTGIVGGREAESGVAVARVLGARQMQDSEQGPSLSQATRLARGRIQVVLNAMAE